MLPASPPACFSPAVALRFSSRGKALDVFVCFHCRKVAFQAVGSRRSLDTLVFDPVRERLFELVAKARPDDARLAAVRREWDQEAERGRKGHEDEQRWRAAIPSSLAPYWDSMGGYVAQVLKPMSGALARQFPEPRPRILALLEWYGAGAGPWSGYPSYEDTAEELLLTHSTVGEAR